MEYKEYNGYHVYADGRVYSTKRGIFLKPDIQRHGYHQVRLSYDGASKAYKVHRLVGLLFIPNPDRLPQINHKDGNKSNNNVSNLEWCTALHNNNHAKELGLLDIAASNSKRWKNEAFRENTSTAISNGRIGKFTGRENSNYRYTLLFKGVEYTARDLAAVFNVSQASIFRVIQSLLRGKPFRKKIYNEIQLVQK